MPKYAIYAMDKDSLIKYTDFKNKISLESVKLSTQDIKRISADIQSERADGRPLFTTDDNGSAFITVAGPLEPKPDVCAILFDMEMTTYADIITATKEAEADDNIKNITYYFDTPGGNVVGLFKTADVIKNTTKPTTAIVTGMCASAGYALASQCDNIEAENISNEIGSIGVATEIIDYSENDKGRGVKRYVLTSENAENKRPDVTTDEGRAKIITRLTDLESVFIEYVAIGRDTTIDNVKENFGRGGVMLSRDALKVGMIDNIQSEITSISQTSNTKPQNQTEGEGDNMEMSAEEIAKIASDAATAAAIQVKTEMTAEMDRREASAKAEAERKAGFTSLLNKYPNQSAMINEEMTKEGATANADFAIKVAEAEAARISALNEQNDNADDNASTDAKTEESSGTEAADNSGNVLAGALGLKVEAN